MSEFYGTDYDEQEDSELERLMFEQNGYRKILGQKLPDLQGESDDKLLENYDKSKKALQFLCLRLTEENLSQEEIDGIHKSIEIYEEDFKRWELKSRKANLLN